MQKLPKCRALLSDVQHNRIFASEHDPSASPFCCRDKVSQLFGSSWCMSTCTISSGTIYYLLTANRDGRGTPKPDDDKLIQLQLP